MDRNGWVAVLGGVWSLLFCGSSSWERVAMGRNCWVAALAWGGSELVAVLAGGGSQWFVGSFRCGWNTMGRKG